MRGRPTLGLKPHPRGAAAARAGVARALCAAGSALTLAIEASHTYLLYWVPGVRSARSEWSHGVRKQHTKQEGSWANQLVPKGAGSPALRGSPPGHPSRALDSGMADQEARILRIQRRLPSSHSSAGPAGTNERSRFASSAAATPPQASSASSSPQGLTARAAAQAAVAIRWPRPIGILETRGPKLNAVACPRGVAFCAISRRCQHVSIAAVAAVPLVPSRGRPRPYAPMEQRSWRAAQASRRIFASWGVRHPGV